jgi:hypothetical protein
LHRQTLSQYLAEFAGANGFLTGDITPGYLPCPEAAREIKQVAPQARLFAIVRDPAERAFSQWRMLRRLGKVSLSENFISLFAKDTCRIRTRGHYAEQIKRFLKYYEFGPRFRVFLYDVLAKNPEQFLTELYRFLGLSEVGLDMARERHVPEYHGDGLSISPDEEQQLREYYAKHNEDLAALLGMSLSWNRDSRNQRKAVG